MGLRKYVRENHCSAIVQIAPCRVNGACRLLATVGGSGVDNTQCTVYNEDHHNNMDLAMNFHNRPTQSTPGGVLRAVTWVRAPPKQEHERDDLLLAIGGDDCIITIISVTHKRVMHQLVGHNGPVLALEGHPVLQGVLASMGEDHKVHLWLVPSHNAEGVGGAPRRLATLLLSGRTHAMTFLHDGRLLTAHSAGEGLLRLWQLPEFEGLAFFWPPRDARELTLETLRAAEQGAALEIYWPEDATWYDATLTVARPETNEWDIRYPEDGVEETLRLSDPELPPVRPRGCAAAVSNPAQGDALLPEELTMAEHSRGVCAAADARGAQVASMTTIGSHSVATMRANGQLEVWTLPADGMDRGAIRISGTRVPGYNTEERFVACKIGASECGSFVAVGNGVGDTYVYAVDVPGMPKQVGHALANKRARCPVVAATITGRGTRVLSASGKGFIWRYEPDPGETKKNTSGAWAGQL